MPALTILDLNHPVLLGETLFLQLILFPQRSFLLDDPAPLNDSSCLDDSFLFDRTCSLNQRFLFSTDPSCSTKLARLPSSRRRPASTFSSASHSVSSRSVFSFFPPQRGLPPFSLSFLLLHDSSPLLAQLSFSFTSSPLSLDVPLLLSTSPLSSRLPLYATSPPSLDFPLSTHARGNDSARRYSDRSDGSLRRSHTGSVTRYFKYPVKTFEMGNKAMRQYPRWLCDRGYEDQVFLLNVLAFGCKVMLNWTSTNPLITLRHPHNLII